MDNDLKQYLDKKFAALDTKFATKRELETMEERVDSRIEGVEISLASEFNERASPAELRRRSQAAVLRALDIDREALN
jgi:hypothetical protein